MFVAAGPVSRILSAGLLRQDGHSSGPNITVRLKRPTRRLWRAEPARAPGGLFSPPRAPSLFGLAPCGVCPARRITAAAVRSYRTFSPLPRRCRRGGIFSVALSVEWTRPSEPGRGTLPDVIRHTALWSSDFPPPPLDAARATVRSSCQQCHYSGRRRRTSGVGTQTSDSDLRPSASHRFGGRDHIGLYAMPPIVKDHAKEFNNGAELSERRGTQQERSCDSQGERVT